MKNHPIGVFDSGYGGLTVLKDMVQVLPEYDFLYLGDNRRAPYGNLPFDTVYAYTWESVQWLFEQGCQLVILACNTASAKALRTIQHKNLPPSYPDHRVLGVIRPTAEVIGDYSRTGHIGVLGTRGTVASASYLIEIAKFFPQVTVTQEACPEWVSLVENNLHLSEAARQPVQRHIRAILSADAQIDSLLLACTHYPLLYPTIREQVPEHITILSQGAIVANSLRAYLHRHPEINAICTKNGERTFCTTGDSNDFNAHAGPFFGSAIHARQVNLTKN